MGPSFKLTRMDRTHLVVGFCLLKLKPTAATTKRQEIWYKPTKFVSDPFHKPTSEANEGEAAQVAPCANIPDVVTNRTNK